MSTHTKIDLYGALNIVVRTFSRMDQNCRKRKDDYLGQGDMTTKE